MARSDDIKSLTQDIVASYEARVNALGQLVADTHSMLDDFRIAHGEMSYQLMTELGEVKHELSEAEGGRLKQARADLQQRQAETKERIGQVSGMLSDLKAAHEQMSRQLKTELGKVKHELNEAEAERLEQAKADLQQRQAEVRERIEQVTILLNDLRAAHQEMSTQLKADLGKAKHELSEAEAERLEQTKADLKQRLGQAKERVASVNQLLGEFRAEGEKTAAAWQKLANIVQGKRGMKAVEITVPPKAPPAEEEAMPPAEPAEMAPGKADLSDGVFAYLADHPDGARMTELEEEFGTARIQMAQILKGLMDENKVEKRDMDYFAL